MSTDVDPVHDPLSMFELSNKCAIVTGASGTFGRAISCALAAMRCRVLLASGSVDGLEQLQGEIRGRGGEATTCSRRAETVEDAEAIVAAAVQAYGSPDLLVVASGYNEPAPIQEMTYEAWQRVMDANVRGPWLMAKAFGSLLLQAGKPGKVLFVSSVRGRHGNVSGYSAYCPSKGGIDALTRVLATEWGKHGINVNAIAPPIFRSTLTKWIYDDTPEGNAARARNLARIPLGRLAEVEDLIGISIYLLSPASDFCTGQVMYVDGGFTAA